VAKNAFLKHLGDASAEEQQMFKNLVGEHSSGTLVILTKCDNITNKNTSSFAATLKSHLGRTHRYFIESGRKILVNDELIPALDPLQLADEPEVVIDEVFQIRINDEGKERTESVRARIVLVAE